MDVARPTQAQLKAADAIAQAISKGLSELKVVHAETAVTSAGRIAGTFLFRDFKFPAENVAPGTVVLSDKANEVAPLLFNTLAATLQALGVSTDPQKRSNFPGHSHPRHAARLSLTETQSRLEPQIRKLATSFALNPREAAQSCAIAAGRLIQTYASALDPNVGFAMAAYGFIEGLKTMPPPLAIEEKSPKRWYAFWK
jgi:hypothetical protein